MEYTCRKVNKFKSADTQLYNHGSVKPSLFLKGVKLVFPQSIFEVSVELLSIVRRVV